MTEKEALRLTHLALELEKYAQTNNIPRHAIVGMLVGAFFAGCDDFERASQAAKQSLENYVNPSKTMSVS